MPRKGQGLRVERRADTGALTIVGTVAGQRIRKRAESNNPRLAQEEATQLAAEILRAEWHGPRRGARPLAEAVTLYLEAAPRSPGTHRRLALILAAAGNVKLAQVNQSLVNRMAREILIPGFAPDTLRRGVIVPLRAVMSLAHKQGWCDPVHFVIPKSEAGRTLYLLPDMANRLVAACEPIGWRQPSLKTLVELVLGTGARMSEALELDWADVDLQGARAILWKTKGGKPRHAYLPPGLVAALANLPWRDGRVVRRPDGKPYADPERLGGGQMKHAWRLAKERAGIDPVLTQHDLRHTWASWHYALYRDPLRLKLEGGWASLDQVERYVHLMPQGHEEAIRAFWHGIGTAVEGSRLTA